MKTPFVLLATAAIWILGCPYLWAAQTGSLRVSAIDSFGDQIPCKGAKATNLETKKSFTLAPIGKSCFAKSLPLGEYSIKVTALSFVSRQQNETIGKPFTMLQFVLPFPYEGAPVRATLTGKVLNAGTKRVWVQLVGLFVRVNAYSYLDQSGRYELQNLDPAKYFLCVLEGGKVRYGKVVDVHAINKPLSIILPGDNAKH